MQCVGNVYGIHCVDILCIYNHLMLLYLRIGKTSFINRITASLVK